MTLSIPEKDILQALKHLGEDFCVSDIGQTIRELRGREMSLAVLHSALTRMEKNGLIEQPSEGYFKITTNGQWQLESL